MASEPALSAPPVSDARPAAGSPVIDTLFLLFALAALTIVTARPKLAMDEDIWWHLRSGAWILAHRAVPDVDVFSAHAGGRPWIAYSWLFEVLAVKMFGAWKYRGMMVLTTALALVNTACLTVFLARFVNLRRAMILSFCSCLALVPLRSPRPWLFTIFFFTIEFALLWIARERNRPALLLPVVPLLALWANIHVQFVYGLGLIGLFAIEASVPARLRQAMGAESGPPLGSRILWCLLGASGLATLVNPYGWNLYRVVWQYTTQTAPLLYVQEMQSIPFRLPSHWIALMLILAAVFALGRARRANLLLISLMAFSCYCGFRSQRDIWFPVTVAVIALAFEIGKAAPEFARSRCVYPAVVAASLALALVFLSADPRFSDEAMNKAVAENYPVSATAWLEAHKLPGPLMNTYNWGGYLIWRLPGMPVSIDGRANLYEKEIEGIVNTIHGLKGWRQDPDLAKARTILIEDDSALASILRVDPEFRQVYEDRTAAIFQPVTPPGPLPPDGKGAATPPVSPR